MTSTVQNPGGEREHGLFCAPAPAGQTLATLDDDGHDYVTAVRALLPPAQAAEQARVDELIAEAVTHWRWRDPAVAARYGLEPDTPGHPQSGRCARDGRPLDACGGQSVTRDGWIYGSEACAAPLRARVDAAEFGVDEPACPVPADGRGVAR